MILRKPYAFFIKYFKVFHLIISLLSIYLMIRMSSITGFIDNYLSNPLSKYITKAEAHSVFSFIDFLIPAVLLFISLVLWSIMKLKKKPHKMYIFTTIAALVALVLNIYTHSKIIALITTWLRAEELSAIVDVYAFAMAMQMATCILCISRVLGFNIKNLDFSSDIAQFNVDSNDDEEFEVALDFDFNDVKRDLKKGSRHVKYFYKENNTIIKYGGIALGVIILLSIAYTAYQNRKIVVKSGELNFNGFTVKVNDSYFINSDLKGNNLKDNKSLLVVSVDITNNTEDNKAFLSGTTLLNIGDTNYSYSRLFDYDVSDLGTVYNGDKIRTKDTVTRLFVFEVPEARMLSKKLFGVKELGYTSGSRGRYYYVKLNPKYYNSKKNKTKNYKMGDTLSFEDSILGDGSIKIKSFDIQKRYKVSYNYCYRKNNCIKSYEYLVPQNVISNTDKALLKITGEFNLSNITFKDFYKLFASYGYIEYKKDGKVYYQNNKFYQIKSNKSKSENTYYIEVYRDIMNADSITLGLKVRNINYKYKLGEVKS